MSATGLATASIGLLRLPTISNSVGGNATAATAMAHVTCRPTTRRSVQAHYGRRSIRNALACLPPVAVGPVGAFRAAAGATARVWTSATAAPTLVRSAVLGRAASPPRGVSAQL